MAPEPRLQPAFPGRFIPTPPHEGHDHIQDQTKPCHHQQSPHKDTAKPETTTLTRGHRISLSRGRAGSVGGSPR